MTGLLKRLPMYLFHRGLGLNVVREEVLEKCFYFFFLEILKWRFLFGSLGPGLSKGYLRTPLIED